MITPQARNKLLKIGAVFVAAIATIAVGIFIGVFYINHQYDDCHEDSPLVNKGVVCGNPHVISKASYTDLNVDLNEFIKSERQRGNVNQVSVYFRDLNNGPAMGINELEDFAPASLLKLPLAMVYLRNTEIQPGLLGHQLEYNGQASTLSQNFVPTQSAVPGHPYEIEDLLRMMISYSDNESYVILNNYMLGDPYRQELYQQGLQEMGIITPENSLEEVINTRTYSSIFRLLYNVTFLDKEQSQKVLGWLSKSDFNQGLEAGLPEDVKAAHKFGERFTKDGVKQLHDCGIVYYPDNPYLLCVMTKGKEWNKLTHIISTISEMTYEEVDSRRL